MHALAKEPGERIGSAEELAARLRPLLADSEELREDLDRTLHTTATLLIEREGAAEPGSTQDRLAEQFGLEATPRPETSKPARRPRRIETRNQELAALLANAQLLARLEQYDRAKHELDRLLGLDPDSREGRELLESVEGALERRREAARKKAEEAQRRAEEEARKRAEAEEEARRKAEEEARRKAEEEERKRAEEEEARKRAEEEARRKAEEEERRRAEALEQAVAAVDDLVSRGDLDGAGRRLEAAREELGDDPALKPAEKAIEKRRKEAGKLLGRARKAAGKDPEKAQKLLWEALDLVPAFAEAQELLEELVTAIRERELERAVAEAVRSVSGRIADGELDRAEEELEFARGSYGERPEIEEVAGKLDRARASAEALRREEEEARKREEEEARRKAEEEERRRAEEEERKRAEEAAQKKAEEEARKRAEEEERKKAEEEERKREEERAEEERKQAQEEARKREEEEARKRAEKEEEDRRREAEEAEAEAAAEEAADATVLTPREEAPEQEPPPEEPEEEVVPVPAPSWDEAPVEADAAVEDRRPRPRWLWGLAAGLVLLVASGLTWYLVAPPAGEPATPAAPADRGFLILDALPWAEIVEIRDAEGEPVPLEGPRHTPVRLALPPGTYTISLEGPASQEPMTITAEIEALRSTERVVELGKVDVDEYLEGVGL